MEWETHFGGNDYAYSFALEQTGDGGFIVAGESTETDAWLDIRLTKISPTGSEEWVKYFDREDDIARDIKITPDGGYILVGSTGIWGTNHQAWIIKTDSLGNKQWELVWGGAGAENAFGVDLTNDGGYIVVGDTTSYGSGGNDLFILKIDSTGQETWYKTYGGEKFERGNKVYQKENGNFIIAGENASETGFMNAWYLETDEKGNLVNSAVYGGEEEVRGYDITSTSNCYIMVGNTCPYKDVYLVISREKTVSPTECTEDDTGVIDFPTTYVTPGIPVTIPLRMQNAPGNVQAMGFDITIPEGLTFKSFEKGSLVPAGYVLDVNLISANTLRCGAYKISGTDVIAAGASGEIVKITFDVADTITCPQKISLSALKDDISTWSSSPGCLECGCNGDTNNDGQITPADALNAFEKYMLVCPTSAGLECDSFCSDVNKDGMTTPGDALCIFRKYLNIPCCLD
ncbi:MAG: cohesin domain-containing protein [Desulfococcaceae bacterium]